MPLDFPISIRPRVVAELGRIFQHLFSDVRPKATERVVVVQRTPRDRVVAVVETHKTTEAHDRIGNTTGGLVDDHMIDLTDLLVADAVHFGAMDVLA